MSLQTLGNICFFDPFFQPNTVKGLCLLHRAQKLSHHRWNNLAVHAGLDLTYGPYIVLVGHLHRDVLDSLLPAKGYPLVRCLQLERVKPLLVLECVQLVRLDDEVSVRACVQSFLDLHLVQQHLHRDLGFVLDQLVEVLAFLLVPVVVRGFKQ